MSYFYLALSLLLFLTLFSFLLTRRKLRLEESRTEALQTFSLAAQIAVTAANDVFHLSLDYSDRSVPILDEMIGKGWQRPQTEVSDTMFILAAYLGETLIHEHSAVWQFDQSRHPDPFLLFPNQTPASPFDLIKAKFAEPNSFDLAGSYNQLLEEAIAPPTDANG